MTIGDSFSLTSIVPVGGTGAAGGGSAGGSVCPMALRSSVVVWTSGIMTVPRFLSRLLSGTRCLWRRAVHDSIPSYYTILLNISKVLQTSHDWESA